MSLSVFFLPMARVGAAVTMRLMMRSSVGMMQTDDTHCIHSFPDCVWRLVPSVTRFRVFRYVLPCLPKRTLVPSETHPRAFRYAPAGVISTPPSVISSFATVISTFPTIISTFLTLISTFLTVISTFPTIISTFLMVISVLCNPMITNVGGFCLVWMETAKDADVSAVTPFLASGGLVII